MENKDKKVSVDYLELINQLMKEISRPGITLEALCQFMMIKTLSFLNPIGGYINKLDRDGKVRTLSSCGMDEKALKSWDELPFAEEVPGHDAMRSESIVWLADSNDWYNLYPDLAKYRVLEDLNTFIAVPIDIPGSAAASFGVMCFNTHKQSKQLTSFLWTVSGLISLYFTNHADTQSEEHLTPRHLEILDLIAKNFTNSEIAKSLGYSESTIRHETMKIYQILGVSGRKEAISIAIANHLIKS